MRCTNKDSFANKGIVHLPVLSGSHRTGKICIIKKREDFVKVAGGRFIHAKGFLLQGRHRKEYYDPTMEDTYETEVKFRLVTTILLNYSRLDLKNRVNYRNFPMISPPENKPTQK